MILFLANVRSSTYFSYTEVVQLLRGTRKFIGDLVMA